MEVALETIRSIRNDGVQETELEQAKAYLAGTYPMRTETNEAMAAAIADVDYYGLPLDWVEHYRERIHAVTRDEVRTAAQKHLFAELPVLVVVGKARELRKQLKGLGRMRLVVPRDLD